MLYPHAPETLKLSSATDEILVAQAKLGAEAAFSELWHRHSKKILRTLCQITKNPQDAEDAFQETFLKAYAHLKGFDGRAKFSTWLTRIAINSALMMLRKRKNYPVLVLDVEKEPFAPIVWRIPDATPNAEACLLHAERLTQLRGAIRRLPPSLRTVIDICLTDEMSNQCTAELAGLSLPATKSRLLRARGALRTSLQRKDLQRRSPLTNRA